MRKELTQATSEQNANSGSAPTPRQVQSAGKAHLRVVLSVSID